MAQNVLPSSAKNNGDLVIIGIDPGLHGALAEVVNGRVETLYDMPVHGKKGKAAYNVPEFLGLLQRLEGQLDDEDEIHVFVERSGGWMSKAAARSAGYFEGMMDTASAALLKSHVHTIAPKEWQGTMLAGTKSNLETKVRASMAFASLGIPSGTNGLTDGKIDAALIALYGNRLLRG